MKNRFLIPAVMFIAGLAIGALIFWLCSCCCGACHTKTITPKPPVETSGFGPTQVTMEKANTCFKAYYSNFVSVDTLKGFSINMRQFTAMQQILAGDSTVHGFRIYMGMDSLNPVRLVVGFGSPDHEDVYETSDENSGPCPFVCDTDSPVTRK